MSQTLTTTDPYAPGGRLAFADGTRAKIRTPFGVFKLDRLHLLKHWSRPVTGVSIYRAARPMTVFGRSIVEGDYFPQWHFKPLAELYVPGSVDRAKHVGTFDINGAEWKRRPDAPTTPPPNLVRAA